MPEAITFLKALAIGFLISMPVGPVGIICITRTLEHGFKAGLAIGLGAACADIIFSFIAGTSLTYISNVLEERALIIQFLGAIILASIALYGLRKEPPQISTQEKTSPSYLKATVLTFLMTLANPLSIISYIAIFSLFSFNFTLKQMPFVILGIFTGAMLWWTSLSYLSNFSRKFLSVLSVYKIRRTSLHILLLLSLAAFANAIINVIF